MKRCSMSLKLFGMLPMQPFSRTSIILESCANHGGTLPANKPKGTNEGVGYFQGGTPSDNLIAFKRAKALARRTYVVNAERILDPVCVFNHIVTYQSTVMEKGQSSEWPLSGFFNIPILETSTALYSSPLDVANLIGTTFASVSAPIHIALHSGD
ncbi:hypothetical protein TNCV_4952121 [Trichonephila clavipes]|nr:hypothetical protein TNCV_4952121 [Trichonephila clavipes]